MSLCLNSANFGYPEKVLISSLAHKESLDYIDKMAALPYSNIEKWYQINRFYYEDLQKICQFLIRKNATVLELGCQLGDILNCVNPSYGVGINPNPDIVVQAKIKYSHLEFRCSELDEFVENRKFDYVLLSNTLSYVTNIQKVLQKISTVCHPSTKIVIIFYNPGWETILKIASNLKQRMPIQSTNWLSFNDLQNLLNISGFEVIKHDKRFLIPRKIPFISDFINKYLAHLPYFNQFCLTEYIVAWPQPQFHANTNSAHATCSVIIPAQNEFGNIEKCVTDTPQMGCKTEIIFVHGHSIDKTWEEIQRVQLKYMNKYDIKIMQQKGRGKGNAVQEGLQVAQGDVIIILDADLTVYPRDLVHFFEAIVSGYCELANGCRLVYPLLPSAMPYFNRIANRIFAFLLSYLLNIKIKDSLCGTKAILRSNYNLISCNRSYFGNFDPFGDFDLLFGSAKLSFKITDIPVRYHPRTYGKSNISHARDGLKLLKMCLYASRKIKFI